MYACTDDIHVMQDLAICVHGTNKVDPSTYLNTEPFMDAVAVNFEKVMKK